MERLLLKDLVEELPFSDRARGLSPKTIKKHGKTLSLFLKFLEEKNIDSLGMVTVSHVRGFLIKNIEEGKAESYVNSHLRSIRAFFRYCVDENHMREKENPCLYVKWVKERQVVINTFSDDEVKQMLKYAKQKTFTNVKRKDKYHLGLQAKFTNERNYLLLLILVDTGLRISEVMNLKHYHIEESQIKVENGKGKKDRVVHYFLYVTYFFIEKPKKLSKIIRYLLVFLLGGVIINVITTKAYLRPEVNEPIVALSTIIISYTIASFLVNLFQEIKKSVDEKTKF